MTTLIIGGGLVGAHAARALMGERAVLLLDARPDMNYIQRIAPLAPDRIIPQAVSIPGQLIQICQAHRVENLVVAAGAMASHFRNHPSQAIAGEVRLLFAIQQACRVLPIRRAVFASSLAVYGMGPTQERSVPTPVTAYGHAKLYAEALLSEMAHYVGTEVVILRLAGVLGPPPPRSGNKVSTALRDLLLRPDPLLLGDLFFQGHEYLDARDAGWAVGAALRRSLNSPVEVCNIGRGEWISPERLAEALKQHTGRPVQMAPAKALQQPAGHPLDVTLARAGWGIAPAFSLEETVQYMVETLRTLEPVKP